MTQCYQTHSWTYLVRRTVEYKMDFAVNCQGDCFVTADGTDLHNAKPLTVLACPPELKHGTKLWIEGYGEAVCHDRGGAIKDKRIDIWAGIGVQAVDYIKSSPIKEDNEKSSRSESLILPHHCMSTKVSPEQKSLALLSPNSAAQEIHRLQIHRCVRRLHRPEIGRRRVLAERLTSAASETIAPRFVLGSTRCTSSSSRSSSPLRPCSLLDTCNELMQCTIVHNSFPPFP